MTTPEQDRHRVAAEGEAVWETAKDHHDGDAESAGRTLSKEYIRVRDKLKEHEQDGE